MNVADDIKALTPADFPPLLREITDPPERIWMRGELPEEKQGEEWKFLCVVGSRRFSHYGKSASEKLIAGLAGYPVVIVSGLALGIDAIAHRAAILAALPTAALPGSGLDESVLHPDSNIPLAHEIVAKGGCLMSEYEPLMPAGTWTFPQRNRLMAGMSHATLVVEAGEKSGTLITARLAMEYNRDVLVVPGSILTPHALGSNALLRQGAQAVIKSEDILEALHIAPSQQHTLSLEHLSDDERRIAGLLAEPLTRDELIRLLALPAHKVGILISAMEVKGIVVEELGKLRLA